MIHFEDAEATFTAMVCPHWLPSLFASAFFTILQLHILTLERRCHAFCNAARVCKGSTYMTEVGEEAKAIESDKIEQALKS